MGMGHVRYPTAGCDSASEAQPFYVNAPYGICLAHNGNLTNARELAEVLEREDRRHLNTSSDSEVLLNVLASELQRVGTPRVTPADIFAAVERGVPPLPRRLRRGRHGHRPRPPRLPRSERHPSAGAGSARDAEGRRMDAGLRERRARHAAASSWCATSAPGEVVYIDEHGPPALAGVRGHHAPCALHLRVRVLRAPRLADRQHLGAPRAHAHGRPARGEDPARAARPRHRRGHPDSRHQPHQRHAGGAAPRREVPRRLRQEPLRGPHVHHAGAGAALEVGALASSTPSISSSATRTCCWWTTPSCAARPRRRSSTWRARPAPARCTSPRPRRR